MPVDTNGIVTVNASAAPFNTADAVNTLKQIVAPEEVSISSLVMNALAIQDDNVVIAFDTATRKLVVTTDATLYTDLSGITGFKRQAIVADSDQSGKSLSYSDNGADVGFNADLRAAILEVIAATKPKMTVGALAQRILQGFPDGVQGVVLVDQTSGEISVCTATAHANLTTALEDFNTNPANGITLTLSEPAAQGETLQIFEGAAF